MDTKIGNCSCGKRSIILRKVADRYVCVECAASSGLMSEEATKQLREDTNGKETLLG